MKKISLISRFHLQSTLLFMVVITLCQLSGASEFPQSGAQYEIIKPLYLHGIYKNLNDRQLNKMMAYGTLTSVRFSGPEVAFEAEVPVGSVMTIIGPAPKVKHFFFFTSKVERYFVRLEPDPSRGLEVKLPLDRGIQGNLDGLNPEIFRSLNKEPR